jgi:hypothetical protein
MERPEKETICGYCHKPIKWTAEDKYYNLKKNHPECSKIKNALRIARETERALAKKRKANGKKKRGTCRGAVLNELYPRNMPAWMK